MTTLYDVTAIHSAVPESKGDIVIASHARDGFETHVQVAFGAEKRNTEVRHELLDALDFLETTGDVQVESTQSMQSTLMQRNANMATALDGFAAEYAHAVPVGPSHSTLRDAVPLLAGAVCNMIHGSLRRCARVDAESWGSVEERRRMQEEAGTGLDSTMGTASNIIQNNKNLSGDVFSSLHRKISAILVQIRGRATIEDEELERNTAARILNVLFPDTDAPRVIDQFQVLSVIAATDVTAAIRELLGSSMGPTSAAKDEFIAALEAAATAYAATTKADAGEQCMLDYDDAAAAAAAAGDRALQALLTRINAIVMDIRDDGNLRSESAKAKAGIDEWISRERHLRKQLGSECAADANSLSELRAKLVTAAGVREAQFEANRQGTREELGRMDTEQRDIWEKIRVLAEASAAVGHRRQNLVQEHVAVIEENALRRREFEDWCHAIDEHQRCLGLTEALVSSSIQTLDDLQAHAAALGDLVAADSFFDDALSAFDSQRAEELGEFARIYKDYVGVASALHARFSSRGVVGHKTAATAATSVEQSKTVSYDPAWERFSVLRAARENEARRNADQAGSLGERLEFWHQVYERRFPETEVLPGADVEEQGHQLVEHAGRIVEELGAAQAAELHDEAARLEMDKATIAAQQPNVEAASSPPRGAVAAVLEERKRTATRSSISVVKI